MTAPAESATTVALEKVPCGLCGETDHRLLVVNHNDPDLARLAKRFEPRFVICDRCGFVYQTPRAAEQAIDALYTSKDYRRMPPAVYSQLEIRETAADQASWIGACLPGTPPGPALDIGCSSGNLLDGLKAAGWQTFGVEPTEAYAAYARSNGHAVATGLWSPATFAGQQFRLITLSHTLEHLHHPAPLLKAIRSQLTDDGHLFIEVPLLTRPTEALWDSFFAWYHLYVFDRETLTAFLRVHGFEVISYAVAPRGQRALARKCEPARQLPTWTSAQSDGLIKLFDDYIFGEYRHVSRKRRFVKAVGRGLTRLFGSTGKALIRDAYLRFRYRREYARANTGRQNPGR